MANKRGPIGKIEAFYIEHNLEEKTIQDIASDLERSVSSVEKFIQKNKITIKKQSMLSDQFARQKGSVVMTENASMMIDEKKKHKNKLDRSCVTTIK